MAFLLPLLLSCFLYYLSISAWLSAHLSPCNFPNIIIHICKIYQTTFYCVILLFFTVKLWITMRFYFVDKLPLTEKLCALLTKWRKIPGFVWTLGRKIPRMEDPGGVQSTGSLKVGHDWATSLSLLTCMHWRRKWQPTPVFLPGESQGRGSLVGYRLWGRTELDMTEAT